MRSQAYAGKLLPGVVLSTAAACQLPVEHAKTVLGQNVAPTYNIPVASLMKMTANTDIKNACTN